MDLSTSIIIRNYDKKSIKKWPKVVLKIGSTSAGSFGNAVLRRFLNTAIKEIRIFSRDEKM